MIDSLLIRLPARSNKEGQTMISHSLAEYNGRTVVHTERRGLVTHASEYGTKATKFVINVVAFDPNSPTETGQADEQD